MREEHREKIRRQWLALLPVMVTTNTFIGFDEYYNDVTGAGIDLRPTDVILQDLEGVEAELEEAANGS